MEKKCKILVGHCGGIYLIRMEGDVRLTLCASLNRYIDGIFKNDRAEDVLVDLLAAQGVDSTTLGLLVKLAQSSKRSFGVVPTLFCTDPTILRTLESMSIDELFHIIRDEPPTVTGVEELPCDDTDAEEIRAQVLAAHRLLIEVNPKCRGEFVDLISALEEQAGS